MAALYWFALIIGGGMLAFSTFGDLFHTHVDGHAGDAGDGHGDDLHAFQILTLRNATYFLFSFGATGLGLELLASLPSLLVLVIALAVALVASGLTAAILRYVQQTGSGARLSEDSFVGCTGRVVLPFTADGLGRVIVQRGAREYELRARPFDQAGRDARVGTEIIVIEMSGGTAVVTRLEQALALPGGEVFN